MARGRSVGTHFDAAFGERPRGDFGAQSNCVDIRAGCLRLAHHRFVGAAVIRLQGSARSQVVHVRILSCRRFSKYVAKKQ